MEGKAEAVTARRAGAVLLTCYLRRFLGLKLMSG